MQIIAREIDYKFLDLSIRIEIESQQPEFKHGKKEAQDKLSVFN